MAYRSHAIAASDESATEGPISTLRETVRIYVVQLDNTVERDAKIFVGDVLRAHERPEQGDRVEDDAGDAEVDVLVGSWREAAVGAGAHDTLACPLDARVEREQLEKRGLCPAGYFNASAAPVLCDLRDLAREDDKCLLRVGVCPARADLC